MKLTYGKQASFWREFGFRVVNGKQQRELFAELNLWWWFVTLDFKE